jgi:ketosteroid isomerase-like protein
MASILSNLLAGPPVRYCSLMSLISAPDVSAQVQRFWNAYCHGSKDALEQMYLPSAIVFAPFARRSEPAQLTLARRLRKFSNRTSSMSAEPGAIDVQIAGDAAIASYPYHFHLLKTNSDGSRLDLDAPYSRATQIFQLDQNGVLRIVHEHFSLAEPAKKVLLSREEAAAKRSLHAPGAAGQNSVALAAPFQVSDTGSFPAANPIAPEEVRATIRGCWEALRSKSKDRLDAFYLPTALLFNVDSRRSEPARLFMMRRDREFFSPASSASAEIGAIDVQSAGAVAAVASYTFQFQLVRQLPNGKYLEQHVPHCRATTVLRRDETGALRILHEHQSAIEVATSKEVGARESVLSG